MLDLTKSHKRLTKGFYKNALATLLLSSMLTNALNAATANYENDAFTERNTKRYDFEIPAELLFSSGNFAVVGQSGFTIGLKAGASLVSANYVGAIYKPASVVEYQLERTAPSFESGYTGGVDIGYRYYIGDSWGIRGHLDYNFSYTTGYEMGIGFSNTNPITTTSNVTRFGHLITLNLDFFYNYGAIGVFLGVGVGYEGYSFTSKNTSRLAYQHSSTAVLDGADTLTGGLKGGVALPINVGLSFDINENNQLSIGAKIPILSQSYNYTQGVKGTSSSTGYNPTFSGTAPQFRNYIIEAGYTFTF